MSRRATDIQISGWLEHMAAPILPPMEKRLLELSLLSKFVLACQLPRLSDSAGQLGVTPAALSMALRDLEDRLGLKLFARRGGGLDLLPTAFWLFRVASQTLYLEQHAREARPPPGRRMLRLTVELDLSFAIGRVSKALLRSCQQLITTHPDVVVDWEFSGFDRDDAGDSGVLDDPRFRVGDGGHVHIYYRGTRAGASGAELLHEDPWVVIGGRGTESSVPAAVSAVSLLRMRAEVMSAIADFAAERGFADRLQYRDEEPAQISDILRGAPHLRLLIPGSLAPTRLGLAHYEQSVLEPSFASAIHGSVSPHAASYGKAFLEAMRRNLAEEQPVVFDPKLTSRQIRFFNLAIRTGSIAAAARLSNTAQSSVSKQITLLERAIGLPLLRRAEDGTTLEAGGERFGALLTGIEERQDWILRKARDIAAHSEARVTIGTLPSSGHDSALTERIARVVTTIHSRFPDWQLQVVESSNTSLNDRVRAGELNLAIVGIAHPQVTRIRLGASEPLSVICNPAIDHAGRKEFTLEDACALPLVLGRQHLSIHQNFAEAARLRGLRLTTVADVGSLALAIAMIRQAPLCTILPASSVRRDIEAGRLFAVPLRQDELSGSLSVIFSAERELSEAERTIVQEFLRDFRDGRTAPQTDAPDDWPAASATGQGAG